jgi:hypothetical protein
MVARKMDLTIKTGPQTKKHKQPDFFYFFEPKQPELIILQMHIYVGELLKVRILQRKGTTLCLPLLGPDSSRTW